MPGPETRIPVRMAVTNRILFMFFIAFDFVFGGSRPTFVILLSDLMDAQRQSLRNFSILLWMATESRDKEDSEKEINQRWAGPAKTKSKSYEKHEQKSYWSPPSLQESASLALALRGLPEIMELLPHPGFGRC